MPRESDQRDTATLWQIVDAARRVLGHASGLDRDTFLKDGVRMDAVIYRIMVIGEGSSRLSAATRERFPSVPWRAIIDQRNRLIHGYDQIRLDLLWELVSVHVPALLATLEPAIPPAPSDPEPA